MVSSSYYSEYFEKRAGKVFFWYSIIFHNIEYLGDGI